MATSLSRKRSRSPSDPRKVPGFVDKYFPRADGCPAPLANTTDRNGRIKLEFLAMYYRLNCCYARLLEARHARSSSTALRARRERAALQTIESRLRERDALEDRHAPYGVIAEPVMEGGFAVDVKFSFGNTRSATHYAGQVFSSSAYFSITLPPGVKLNSLKRPDKAH